MKKKKFSLFVVVFIIFFPFSAFSQEGRGGGRLEGTVVDENGKPIKDVNLILKYPKYSYQQTTVSNKKGKWVFSGLGQGNVSVSAKKEKYQSSGIFLLVSGAARNPKQIIVLKKISDIKKEDGIEKSTKDMFVKGNELFQLKKYDEALSLFREFLTQSPSMYKVRINIANCHMELKQYDQAIEEFKKVLEGLEAEKSPDAGDKEMMASALASIGDIYMKRNDLENAEKFFKKSIETDEKDPALAYNVAEILFVGGKTEEAIKYYKLAVKIKPDWAKAYKQMGYALLNKGDIEEAINSFKKFMELDPDSPEKGVIEEVIKSLQQ